MTAVRFIGCLPACKGVCIFPPLPLEMHGILLLRPAQILAHQLIEALVVLGEELSQSGHYHGVHVRVLPALGLSEAAIAVVVPQAVESLRLVKVKVLALYPVFDA